MNSSSIPALIAAIAIATAAQCIAQISTTNEDADAKLLQSIRDRNERAALCEKLIPAYLSRFRFHRDRDPALSLEEIARLTRADMPRSLKTDDAKLKPIYDEDIPSILNADIASIEKTMAAHFIAGRYHEAFAAGEKEPRRHDPMSLQLMSDACLALAKNSRDKKELAAAVVWLQRAADAVDKRKNPGPWAQDQRPICKLLCQLGRHDEALATMREVVEIYRRFPGENHPAFASVTGEYCGMLISAGKTSEAIPIVEKLIKDAENNADKRGYDAGKMKRVLEILRKQTEK